jgi:Cu(I)/Ag(I) efflux system membrane fusion protein
MYASASLLVRLRSDGIPEPTGLEGKFVCPMHPEIVRDGPGKCPVCEMPLERVPDWRPALKSQPAGHGDHTGHGVVTKEPSKQVAPEGTVLAVRATAVLDTGKRKVSYRVTKDGAYELVELEVGVRAESKDKSGRSVSYYPIRKGLIAGDRVVVRGGFLLDSQRQIEGMPSLLFPQGQAGVNLHSGHGVSPPAPVNVPGKEPVHKH